jgi:glycerol-3-phosphate dehydrogenase (NAD(P)+)
MAAERLSVLGCGRWGGFHLWYGSRVGLATTGWEPEGSKPLAELADSRRNEYLELPEDVRLTTDLDRALDADQLIASVPAQSFRRLARSLSGRDLSGADLVLCMKGIERRTGRRLSQVVEEEGVRPRSVSTWVGPGHPQQLVRGVPSCMIVASGRLESAERVARRMGSPLIRFYRSADLVGVEVGAAAKNVIGIAAGILDGMGYSGLKGSLMARAPQEVARLVAAMGGDWRSVYGLSHLGDYEATLFSPYSRNRTFGEVLAGGGEAPGLAEGVETSAAICRLARSYGVDMPITRTVRSLIEGETTPEAAIDRLFGRPEKEEFPDSLR